MNILNNIWMAVSTPNEVLVNILLIPASIIENFLIMTLFISILKVSATTRQKFMYVISMTCVSAISTYLIPHPFNIVFNFLMMILIAYYTFKITFLKSSISIILCGVIFNIIVSLILNPYITLLNISSQDLITIVIYRFPYMLLIYTVLLIIIAIVRKTVRIKLNLLEDLDNKTKLILLFNLILGLITFIFQTIIAFYYIDKLPIIITFFSFIFLLAYFCLTIYSLTRVFKLVLTTQKLQSAEEYNNTLQILHDNVRGFKHDFDNIITTIGGYIRTDDMKGLKKYYLELEDDSQRVNNLYVLNPSIVNNDGIYNLLTKKYNEAEEKGIKVNLSFLLDLSNLKMKIYEFARILGILLDNAIEASSESKEKIINITFRNDSKNSRQLIIIENSYSNKDIDTEKIFEKGTTEKENHTGLGLWEVRKILKKNNNANLYTSKTNEFFKQQIEIYY